MKLKDKDKKYFQNLNESSTGSWLIDYLKRLKSEELFDPEKLTEDNVDTRKESWNLIKQHLIDRIKKSEKLEKNDKKDLGDYE